MNKWWILALALVAGCAGHGDQTRLYRDASGARRGDTELHQAESVCQYEMRQMAVGAPNRPAYGPNEAVSNLGVALLSGPGPAVFNECMAARGWSLVGYE